MGGAAVRFVRWVLSVAAGAVAVVILGFTLMNLAKPAGPEPVCTALIANVGRMQGFAWDNHITGSESSWGTVLGEGVTYARQADRVPIAREARRDRVDYERLLNAAPPTLRPRLGRLYALSLDPARAWAHRNDPVVIRDGRAVDRFSSYQCNLD